MEIIDAQIHDVPPLNPWSSELTAEQSIEVSAELAVAAMDAVGVDAAVVNSLMPTVQGHLARYPDRFGGLPIAGPQVPFEGSADELVAEVRGTAGMVGVRLILGYPLDGARIEDLRRGVYEPYLAASERHGLPVFVLAHGFLADLRPVLEAHPDLPVIVDHLGLHTPPLKPAAPELFDDVPGVVELARYPNVAVKFTGAPSLSMEPYPFADLWPRLRPILEAFGTDRLMWGSDFTRCRSLHTYRESVDFLLHTDELSRTDKEQLFAGTIRKWLRWPT